MALLHPHQFVVALHYLDDLRHVDVAAVCVGAQRAAHGEDVRRLHHLDGQSTGRDGALHFSPRGAALHGDGHRGRIDGEDVVETAHVQHHTTGGVRVPALTVTAAGDRDLEPSRARVPHDGLQLRNGRGVFHFRDPRRRETRDIGPEQRVVRAKEVVVRDDKSAGVDGDSEQH